MIGFLFFAILDRDCPVLGKQVLVVNFSNFCIVPVGAILASFIFQGS